MKKQRYIVEIEMPDGDFISAGLIKDIIQTDCDVEDEGRMKVIVQETSLPSNLDEAANNYGVDIRLGYPRVMDETDRYIYNAFKAGAEWMAGQGVRASASVGYYNQCGLSILTEPSIKKLGFKEGDELEITLRKK